MKRVAGFEWEDQSWFPNRIRQYMMDFLRFVLNTGNLYQPVAPLLVKALQQTSSSTIIDLCSGGAGAIPVIQKNIAACTQQVIPFVLTDLYPNQELVYQLKRQQNNSLTYHSQSVNAAKVPEELKGFRTMFSAFHHFDEMTATSVLQNAVDAGEGIAIFDGGSRSIWFIITILLFQPVAFLLFTPFIRPFSIGRLFFTYIIPIVPLCTIWDGIMSVLRLYTPSEMQQLAEKVTAVTPYTWYSGKVRNHFGITIAYLIGYPSKA